MEKDKEVKRQQFTFSGDWFMLPATEKKTKWRYEHEVASADLFVALAPHFEAWIFEPYIGNKRADRGVKINGQTFYFEVDLCNEGMSVLEEKIENYMKADGRFHVVFSFLGEKEEVQRRGSLLIPYLQKIKRGHQFLLTNHKVLCAAPLAPKLYSPKDEFLSFTSV